MANNVAKIEWANNGEPVDGKYTATIDNGDGSGIQKFEGESHKEVADKLLQAQANATAKIRQMSKNNKPTTAAPKREFKETPLTADEQFTVSQDLQDATKAPAAIKKVVESVIGAPVETIREVLNKGEQDDRDVAERAAAVAFVQATPDFFPCPHNQNLFERYIELHNLEPNLENFQYTYEQLSEAGLLRQRPTEPAVPATPAAGGLPAGTRPRGAVASSTGLRGADSSAHSERKPVAKYTRQDIEAMSTDEYKQKLQSEPGFAALVDKIMAPAQ